MISLFFSNIQTFWSEAQHWDEHVSLNRKIENAIFDQISRTPAFVPCSSGYFCGKLSLTSFSEHAVAPCTAPSNNSSTVQFESRKCKFNSFASAQSDSVIIVPLVRIKTVSFKHLNSHLRQASLNITTTVKTSRASHHPLWFCISRRSRRFMCLLAYQTELSFQPSLRMSDCKLGTTQRGLHRHGGDF